MADELGVLKNPRFTWQKLRQEEQGLWIGSEHLVEFFPQERRYHKITVPPAFGLTPALLSIPVANLHADPAAQSFRRAIEFIHATPLE